MKNPVVRRIVAWLLVLLLVAPLSVFAEQFTAPQLKPTNEVRWIDRIADLPEYAVQFYAWLEENSDGDGTEDALINPTTAVNDGGSYVYTVAAFDEHMPFTVPAGQNVGAVGSEAASAVINAKFKEVSAYVTAVYNAFVRDHAEVFWLSGGSNTRIPATNLSFSNDGTGWVASFTYQIQFVLKDSETNILDGAYSNAAAVYAGIATRDAAVAAILDGAFPVSGSRYEQIKYLNEWLTKHNCYNSNLATAGRYTHSCLSALTGNTGTDGPVCEGYAKAFKVLCDELGIPCVLVDGDAKSHAGDTPESHMWNYVQMENGKWYAVDVTWNDPTMAGVNSAESGVENEKYLLVGSNTVAGTLPFSESHILENRVSSSGIAFTNGPVLAQQSYEPAASAVLAIRMNLGNSLDMQFAVPKNQQADWNGAYAKVTHRGESQEIPVTQWSTDKEDPNLYVVTYGGVAAKEMTDQIRIGIYDKNDQPIGEAYTDSVRDYAMRILDKNEERDAWKMIVDMLYYGAAAQEEFDYKDSDLATAKLSANQKELASGEVACHDATGGKVNARLKLASKIDLQMGIPAEHVGKTITYVFTNHNGTPINETAQVQYDSTYGVYYIVIDRIVVSDSRIMVTVMADGETIATDSIESYAARMKGTINDSPLYQMIMRFSDSARAYFHRNDNP